MHDEVSDTENIRKNLAIERMIVEGCDILLDTSQTFIRQGKTCWSDPLLVIGSCHSYRWQMQEHALEQAYVFGTVCAGDPGSLAQGCGWGPPLRYFFSGAMKNSNTIGVKHERGGKSHSGWTPLLGEPDVLYSSKEDRSVWPVRVAVPDGDTIQAKAQEKPEFLKARARMSGDNVRSECSCLLLSFLTGTSDLIQSVTPVTRWKSPCLALELGKLSRVWRVLCEGQYLIS